jgi:hypothetical protein
MGKVYQSIDKRIQSWVNQQQMFFVATAPSGTSGSVNVSPKGQDTLRVIDEHTLAFLDSGGSGIETVAHVRENGRIVIMMCAFTGPPKIYRFHGTGAVVFPGDPGFEQLVSHFDLSVAGIRSIIRIDVTRVSDSCGFGVPVLEFQAERDIGRKYLANQGIENTRAYLQEQNAASIDGLPGITESEAQAFQGPTDP